MRKSIGVVLDVDGVLIRGSRVIPQALPALRRLAAANIPTLFVTNGGNVTEKEKASSLSKQLGFLIHENQIILSHTPFKRLVPEYKDKNVLVIGCPKSVRVARAYGFNKVVTPESIHIKNPEVHPVMPPLSPGDISMAELSDDDGDVHAALVFSDSADWGLHMQVLTDAIVSHSQEGGKKNLPIYACNADIVYTGSHPLPRFTQGAFVHAFQALYTKYTGQEIPIEFCGKPFKIQYDYAEKLFCRNAEDAGISVPEVYYGIGDNPKSDIRGANGAGSHWTSILVKTGVFDGRASENDAEDPADVVVDTVLDAIEAIILREQNDAAAY